MSLMLISSRSIDREQQLKLGFLCTNGMLKCKDSLKGLLVRKSLRSQKERKHTEAVIKYESGEKPVISCTLGFWGYSWNVVLYINKVFMMCGPHLQGCVQHCLRGELLWVLAALESLAQPATLLCAALCCDDRTKALSRAGLRAFTRS